MKRRPIFDKALVRSMLCGVLVGCAIVGTAWHWGGRALLASPVAIQLAVHQVEPQAGQVGVLEPVVPRRVVDLRHVQASADTQRLAQWVVDSADNGHAPFVIIDKRNALVLAFTPEGELIESTPALLGYALGDHTVPGIGDRPIRDVRPEERTTPAGRFVSEPGQNHLGEAVVWVDYEAAVSLHRLRKSNPAERRAERLASPTPEDNRISYGCVNVPVEFFERVVWPTLGDRRGVIYVTPDVLPLEKVFPGLADAPRLQAVLQAKDETGS